MTAKPSPRCILGLWRCVNVGSGLAVIILPAVYLALQEHAPSVLQAVSGLLSPSVYIICCTLPLLNNTGSDWLHSHCHSLLAAAMGHVCKSVYRDIGSMCHVVPVSLSEKKFDINNLPPCIAWPV